MNARQNNGKIPTEIILGEFFENTQSKVTFVISQLELVAQEILSFGLILRQIDKKFLLFQYLILRYNRWYHLDLTIK